MKPLLFLLFTLFTGLHSLAQTAPKREFRAVWIATVGNIDWPSKQRLSAAQQQNEFVDHLDFLAANGFNAVIVQIRPSADAFYDSPYEPWSRYLSGKQGQAPFPYYDPLTFMVEETHKRNMEFHAWFNPFRALVSSKSNPNPTQHITKTQPNWLVHYGGKSYLNPGIPEAREYVNKIIFDVVKRYDIDGVHIDDYFYPYKISGQTFNDQNAYRQYGNQLSLDDWRRDNINKFVEAMYKGIKREKNYVKVGISPFGIWRNQRQDVLGSATNGTSCYDDLYADVKLWIDNKWLDYVAPQLYWEHGHRLAAFDVLVPWWKNAVKDRALYIGLGLYRMVNAKPGTWSSPQEIVKQLNTSRTHQTEGNIFYSMISFSKIGPQVSRALKSPSNFGTIAIPPTMPWLGKTLPAAPKVNLSKVANANLLTWNKGLHLGSSTKYLVYRFSAQEPIDLENTAKIMVLTQGNSFKDEAVGTNKYKYVVTALDRLWNESKASEIVQ